MWPQARTEGASPALLFLLHTAPSLGSPQALGSAGTLPHSAPQGSDQTSDRTAAWAHIHTGTTPAPSSPLGPSVVLCVRLNTKALEEIDQSTSPLSCLVFLSLCVLEG